MARGRGAKRSPLMFPICWSGLAAGPRWGGARVGPAAEARPGRGLAPAPLRPPGARRVGPRRPLQQIGDMSDEADGNLG